MIIMISISGAIIMASIALFPFTWFGSVLIFTGFKLQKPIKT